MFETAQPITSAPRHLLFVDDEPRVRDSIHRSLHAADPAWTLAFAGSVDEALAHLSHRTVDVIVTDITMPVRDGFDLIGAVASSDKLKHIPVIVLTGLADDNLKRRALDAGAFDLIGKPIRREDLIARLRSVLRTLDYQDSLANLNSTLEQQVVQRTRELEASRTEILGCLAMAGECRDTDTGRHLLRVAQYARLLAEELALPSAEVDLIFKATPLHDIGKLGVPDHILLKPGVLDPSERAVMQRHCQLGYQILTTPTAITAFFDSDNTAHGDAPPSSNPLLRAAAEIALTHHERWDGTGYPNALAGNSIPLSGRIVAVADVYDALTTRRPYKQPIAHEDAVKLLIEGASSHFDPHLISAFTRIDQQFRDVQRAWCDSAKRHANSIASIGTLFVRNKKCA
jgi:putative two-component system response regulator